MLFTVTSKFQINELDEIFQDGEEIPDNPIEVTASKQNGNPTIIQASSKQRRHRTMRCFIKPHE